MVHRNLASGDSFGVGKSTTKGKILIQITSNLSKEQARGVFTKEEARALIREIEKQLAS